MCVFVAAFLAQLLSVSVEIMLTWKEECCAGIVFQTRALLANISKVCVYVLYWCDW